MRRVTIFVSLLIILPMVLFSQTGKISGRVYNEATGEPIPGANIILEGTYLGAAADVNGNYTVLNIPPGKYNVVVSAVGFVKTTIKDVVVNAEKTTFLDVAMKEEVIGLPEVVVEARRPLIDRSLTGARSTVTSDDIEMLPVADVQDVLKTSPSNFGGYIRGGNRYETRVLVEGIDLSDKYYEPNIGSIRGFPGLFVAYHGVNLNFRENINLANIGIGAIQEVNVNSGATSAEFSQAAAGIVNISLKEGKGRISGRVYAKYTPKIKHKGPDVYYGKMPDGGTAAEKYLGEKSELEKIGDEKAKRYTWYPGKYWYGNKPTYEAEISLGGGLMKNLGFYIDTRLFNSYGKYPNEFRREVDLTGKLTYNLTPSIKLTGIGILSDQGYYLGWKNQMYSERFKFFLEGAPLYTRGTLAASLKLTHAISANTFYEVQISYMQSPTEVGYVDSNGDGKIELGETKGNFIKFTPAEIKKYVSRIDKSKFFTTVPGNESESEASFPGAGLYPIARPGAYYEFQKLTQFNVKGSIKSQVTFHHLLSAGFDLKFYTYEQIRRYTVVGRFEFEEYSVKPSEMAFFAQDRIEYSGIIVNLGLRIDAFNSGANEIGNFFRPFKVEEQEIELGGENEKIKVARRKILRTRKIKMKWLIGPRVGISHPISDRASMYYSFSRTMQVPPFSSMYADSYSEFHGTLPVIWLTDEEPIKSTTYEMGLQYAISDYFGLNLSAYYRTIENYNTYGISVKPVRGLGIGNYNIRFKGGYADSRGVELSLRSRQLPIANFVKVSGIFTYTYSYIKALRPASVMALRGQNKTAFNAAVDSAIYGGRIPFEDAKYWAGYEMNITGGRSSSFTGYDRPHRISVALFFDFSGFGNLPVDLRLSTFTTAASGFLYPLSLEDPRSRKLGVAPWNIRTDMRIEAGVKLAGLRVSPFIEIRNVFDRANIIGYDNSTNEGQVLWEQKGIPTGPLATVVFRDGSSAYDIAREVYFGIKIDF